MINAIAIDDEPPALKIVETFCSKIDTIELTKTFTQPAEALKHIKKFPIDLLFLDINMPSISGIDLYKSIEQNTMVIFTTAYSEFAVEGFNLNAIDYLLKPFTFERFNQAVNKAVEFYNYTYQLSKDEEKFLFIRADYTLNKISIADILYIEGLDDYIKIYIKNSRTIVARMTMKNMLEKLPASEFIRVHRSFIVPLNKIEGIRNKTIAVAENNIPIGSSYEANFLEKFKT